MALKDRIVGLLAKVEVTPGTDPTPTVGANTIQTVGAEIIPYEAETVERGTDRATIGNEKMLVVKRRMRTRFGVHLAGAGDQDSVPLWGPLLQGCGFVAGAANSSDEVVFALDGSDFTSLTLYAYKDGSAGNLSRHVGTYARGNLSWQIATGQLPLLQFDYGGLYTAPTDVSAPSFDYTGWQNSVPVTNDNTPTCTLHGENIELVSFTGSLNNRIEHVDIPNFEGIELVDRPISGQIVFRAPSIDVKDWFTSIDNETTGAFQLIHGITAGNIVQFDMPAVQLEPLAYGESQGFVTAAMAWRAIRSASDNDDLVITSK